MAGLNSAASTARPLQRGLNSAALPWLKRAGPPLPHCPTAPPQQTACLLAEGHSLAMMSAPPASLAQSPGQQPLSASAASANACSCCSCRDCWSCCCGCGCAARPSSSAASGAAAGLRQGLRRIAVIRTPKGCSLRQAESSSKQHPRQPSGSAAAVTASKQAGGVPLWPAT